jgi:formate-dependent nitrite reductase membrane component NrfD
MEASIEHDSVVNVLISLQRKQEHGEAAKQNGNLYNIAYILSLVFLILRLSRGHAWFIRESYPRPNELHVWNM